MWNRTMLKERLGDVAVAVVLGLAFILTGCGRDGAPGDVQVRRGTVEPRIAEPAPNATPVSVHPSDGSGITLRGPVTFEEAERTFRAERYGEATELFAAYAAERSENPWGHYMLGLSAWKAGDHARAATAFEGALELDPNHVKSYVNLSRVLLETDRPEEALEAINRALDLDPVSGDGYRLLGRARHALGDPAGAIEAYRRAIVLDGKDVWAMNNLGYVLITEGRFAEALPPLARATELRDDVALFQNNLGIALERSGHPAAATRAYRAALAADSGYAKAAVSLARVEQHVDESTPDTIDLVSVAGRFLADVEAWRVTLAGPGESVLPEEGTPQR